MWICVTAAVLYGATVCIGVFFLPGKRKEKPDAVKSWQVALLFMFAFLLRLILAAAIEGHKGDVSTFKRWAEDIHQAGFKQVYHMGTDLDYPPGYLYILYIAEKLRLLFGLPADHAAYTLIIKLPSILGDMFCGGMLYHAANRQISGQAVWVSGIYLFCPAVLINSAVWGQVDAFCAAILIAAIWLIYRNRFLPGAAMFGLAIACKPQMLVFVPLFLFYAFLQKRWAMLAIGPVTAIAVILLVATPFTSGFDYRWLVDRYFNTMNFYDFYSVNAYNLWAMLGFNNVPITQGVLRTPLHLAGPILATAACGLFLWKAKDAKAVFAAGALLIATTFIFTVKMHERYLFPTLLLLLFAYVISNDRRILVSFVAMATPHFLNVACLLNRSIMINATGVEIEINPIAVMLISSLQVLAYAYMLYSLWKACLQLQRSDVSA